MDVRVGLWRRLSAEELMLLNCGVGEVSWESLGLQGDPTSPFWKRSALGFLWKEWCSSWNSSTLATSCEELTHWKRPWCWEGLGAGGEGDDRGWDGWMASLTRWTWVCVNSRVGDGQGGLGCCDSWGRKESDRTEQLIWWKLWWSLWKESAKASCLNTNTHTHTHIKNWYWIRSEQENHKKWGGKIFNNSLICTICLKILCRDFPGGPVVQNPPCNAKDTGLIPDLGRLHMPVPHRCGACAVEPTPQSPCHTTREATAPREDPHSLQLEKSPHTAKTTQSSQ